MRTVIQRVLSASVQVDGVRVSSIPQGLLCLVGITKDDQPQDIEYTVKKILNLRLWPDDNDGPAWKRCVTDIQGHILCVSQFTLYGSVRKNKPDFHNAMAPNAAKNFYEQFLTLLKEEYVPDRIQDGEFGALMNVSLENDGPVTLIVDSREGNGASEASSGVGTPGSVENKGTSTKALNKARRKEEFLRKQLESGQNSPIS